MKKIFIFSLFFIFYLSAFSNLFYNEGISEISYKEDYGDYINESKMQIIQKKPLKVKWESKNDITIVELDDYLNTKKMSYKSDESELTLVKEGRIIYLKGIFKNKKIEKQLVIDDDPWYQLFSFSFSNFVFSNDETRYYWVFNPFDLSVNKMRVKKISKEKINLNGKTYNTYYLNTRLTGFLSMFWKGEYWYNEDNGMYLKYDGLNIYPNIQNVLITAEKWR